MTKIVLDVGNCNPDHAAISSMLRKNFDAQVLRAQEWSDALAILKSHPVDLILINRKLDIDYSDGIDVLRALKKTSPYNTIPVMLITNYAEHQQQAVAEGAVMGFGKLELSLPETLSKLNSFLSAHAVES